MEFIIFLLVIYIAWSVYQNRRTKNGIDNEEQMNNVSDFERQAQSFWDMLKKDKKESIWEDKPANWMMRDIARLDDWYLQLKEIDKHNDDKRLQHAQDWYDYVYGMWELRNHNTQESLGSHDDQDIDEVVREGRKLSLPLLEIEKRFMRLLDINPEEIKKEKERYHKIDDANWDEEYSKYQKEMDKKYSKKKKDN